MCASHVGHALAPVLVAAKSPEAAKEVIVKAAVPVLVSVTVTDALMVASGWLPKPRLVGANPTAGAVPPLRLKIGRAACREIVVIHSVPVRPAEIGGVKVTWSEQLAPAVTGGGRQTRSLRAWSSDVYSPDLAKEVIVKAAVPVLVSVTVIGALVVASSWLPKSRFVGANPTAGAVPPLRLTF